MKSKLKRYLVIGFISVLVGCVIAFAISLRVIFLNVRSTCMEAQIGFEGDCVEALMAYVESDETNFIQKNKGIWALSQLADERALPLMHKLLEGETCGTPCNRDGCICELLIQRAIKFTKGFTVTKWMYKNL